MNYDNFNAVLAHIEQHPEEWNQNMWNMLGCGTGCCIAGHAEAMFANSRERAMEPTRDNGAKYLGLNEFQARWLFEHDRTLDDFRRVRLVAGYANFPA